ncbi:MAG: nucleotidyltransferase domain-containing protein [Marinilabiliales bacterium]|nr:nucleotidyltransferase domain-containing protein [Marinilabiliales bacterium]
MTTREYILATIGSNRNKLARYGIRKVGLFGSYARDEQSLDSDIDILIDLSLIMRIMIISLAVYDILEQLFNNEGSGDCDEKWTQSSYWSANPKGSQYV